MNSQEKRKIKIDRLKKKITNLHKELDYLYKNDNDNKIQINRIKAELNQYVTRLQNLKIQSDITITDHALLRYIERTLGVELMAIKENMKSYCVNNDHPLVHFEIKDNTVVTVMQKK